MGFVDGACAIPGEVCGRSLRGSLMGFDDAACSWQGGMSTAKTVQEEWLKRQPCREKDQA